MFNVRLLLNRQLDNLVHLQALLSHSQALLQCLITLFHYFS